MFIIRIKVALRQNTTTYFNITMCDDWLHLVNSCKELISKDGNFEQIGFIWINLFCQNITITIVWSLNQRSY